MKQHCHAARSRSIQKNERLDSATSARNDGGGISFLEKLLDGAGVEWKPLGEVAEILNGFAFESSKYSDKGIRVIRISDVQKGKMSDKDLKFYPLDTAEEIGRYLLQENDLVMSLTGNVGRVAMLSKTDLPAALNQRVACIRSKNGVVLTRYLFHFFDQASFENEAMSNATGGGQKNMSTKWLFSYQIPIPCPKNPKKSLEIQAEIVRILDNFTQLTAELTAELTARKKQYAYYRDQLLTFTEDEVEWKTLEEVANFTNGKGHEKDIAEYGKYIVINSKFISTDGRVAKYSNKQISPLFIDDILIVMSDLPNGKALSKTFLVDANDKYTLNQRIGGISVKNKKELLPKFLQYFLDRTPQLIQFDNGVDQTNLRKDQILDVKIPIISLTEQARIVTILDKFDSLTNSLQEGLPREIELRQKQYEYYRNLLLNFPKPAEVKL